MSTMFPHGPVTVAYISTDFRPKFSPPKDKTVSMIVRLSWGGEKEETPVRESSAINLVDLRKRRLNNRFPRKGGDGFWERNV